MGPFFDLLTIFFIIFKLAGFVNWPWLIVLSPTLIGLVLYSILVVIGDVSVNR